MKVEKMTVKELKAKAKELSIKKAYAMNKAELILNITVRLSKRINKAGRKVQAMFKAVSAKAVSAKVVSAKAVSAKAVTSSVSIILNTVLKANTSVSRWAARYNITVKRLR